MKYSKWLVFFLPTRVGLVELTCTPSFRKHYLDVLNKHSNNCFWPLFGVLGLLCNGPRAPIRCSTRSTKPPLASYHFRSNIPQQETKTCKQTIELNSGTPWFQFIATDWPVNLGTSRCNLGATSINIEYNLGIATAAEN